MTFQPGDVVVITSNSTIPNDHHLNPWIGLRAVVIDPESDWQVRHFYLPGVNVALRPLDRRPDLATFDCLVWPIEGLRHAVEVSEQDVQDAIKSILEVHREE